MRHRAASPPASRPGEGTASSRLVGLAVVWLAAFAVLYLSMTPPTLAVQRWTLLRELPVLLLDLVDAPDRPEADVLPTGWLAIPERLPLLLTAAIILAGAWGGGHLLLRSLRLRVDALERTVFAMGLGLCGLSLLTLGCGLMGLLSRGVLGSVVGASAVMELLLRVRRWRAAAREPNGGTSITDRASSNAKDEGHREISARALLTVAAGIVAGLFLLVMLWGALLPPVDFDVREYHLQGPKEFFLTGRIAFLPHNVYTSFPFLTEMLSLLAMVLYGDWWYGALVGKAVLMSFAPLTALALYAMGRRWFHPMAGLMAAVVFLTTPWAYLISTVGYVEGGVTFYLTAAVMAGCLVLVRDDVGSESALDGDSGNLTSARHRVSGPRADAALPSVVLLAGLMAGSAMACKYPAVVQVVIPLGCSLVVHAWRGESKGRDAWKSASLSAIVFAIGVAVTVGPWLLKNLVETGNPVYPLLYSVFGGRDWDNKLDARWRDAHSPDHYHPSDLAVQMLNVTARSDWHSLPLFGLAPLAFLWSARRRLVAGLWQYVGFLFVSWWLLTHRIERFWIPLMPMVALLAGAGATWTGDRRWTTPCAGVVVVGIALNLVLVAAAAPLGYGVWLPDLEQARQRAEASAPGIQFLNARLPAGTRVLAVGEAQVFDARFPVVYNTVFDQSIFAEWVFADERALRDAAVIRQTLHDHGITHVFVNWQEILRYRTTYGFPEHITPMLFETLREQGVLGPETMTPPVRRPFSEAERSELRRWSAASVPVSDERTWMTPFVLYPVLP